MYVWKRLVGKKSLISQSFRRNDRSSENSANFNKEELKSEDRWQPKLLPGEKIVSRASKIVFSSPFGCTDEDEIGELIVTNFRIIFNRDAERDAENNGRKNPQRNKLIGNNDIALYNIDAVYSVKKKKKKPIQDGFIPRRVKIIEIHCKDFRVYVFHLKLLNDKQDAFLILSDILKGAFPPYLDSLFAFHYKGEITGDDVPRFNSELDWKELLEQKGALDAFRVVQHNKDFVESDSLPEYFAVPIFRSEPEFVNSIKMFSNNRCPVWSYTHSNGASIIRMASAMTGVAEELEIKMVEHINRSHCKENGTGCVVVDLSRKLPSLSEIQFGFQSVRNLCMPGSLKEFWLSDASWHSSLESSQWLSYVARGLAVAKEVAADVINGKTVVLKELDAVDFVPFISCLAQLIVDADVRTIDGFQRLVEREWVALGHRFSERYGNCRATKTGVKSSVFQLFLDCAWQMVLQFPSQIQFTEYFLVSIWDSVCLGIFRNFIFDNMRSSHHAPSNHPSREVYISRDQLNPLSLLSVWDWEKQLSDDQIALFYSPQYVFLRESSLKDELRNISVRRGSLLSIAESKSEKSELKDATLMPKTEIPHLRFWSLCYLRWLPPAEVVSGGPASEYLSQCILVEEILYLCQMIKMEADTKRSQNRRSSRLIFGSDSDKSLIRNPCAICVSSSFPFAIEQPTDRRIGPGSFIDSYFKSSVLYDGSSAADELED